MAELSSSGADDPHLGLPAVPAWDWYVPASTTRALGASTLYCVRFRVRKTMVVSALRYVVTTAAGANDTVHGAIGDVPTGPDIDVLAATADEVGKLNSTGVKSLALTAPLTLVPDHTYYAMLGCTALGGTAATLAGVGFGAGSSITPIVGGSSAPHAAFVQRTTVSGAIPDPVTPDGIPGSAPAVWLA